MVKRENNAVPKFLKCFHCSNDVYYRRHFNSMRIFHDPLPSWTTWSSFTMYLLKTNIVVGNLPLFYWRIFYKNSLIEFALQRRFIFLFSVCVVGDSIYPEVTPYTLKLWSKKIPSKYCFIEYRLILSHISVHSHCLLPFNTKKTIKTFFLSNALKVKKRDLL